MLYIMSEDGYFGMGRLSFGGIGKVVMGAVETQIAAATLSPVASSHSASATRSNAPVRPARMTTKQSKLGLLV